MTSRSKVCAATASSESVGALACSVCCRGIDEIRGPSPAVQADSVQIVDSKPLAQQIHPHALPPAAIIARRAVSRNVV